MAERQEFAMLLELLHIIEKELGIAFSPEDHKKLGEFLKNNPNADPEKIITAIITLIERKLQARLNIEKTNKLKDQCRKSRLLMEREKFAKEKKLEPIIEVIDRIIRVAEEKLFQVKAIKRLLNDRERQQAEQYFQNNTNQNDSIIAKANTALLAVVNVGIAGGIRTVVLQSWGNLLNVPGYNPYRGESAGGSAVDQGYRINLGRDRRLEEKAIINAIQNNSLNQPLLEKLMNANLKNPALQTGSDTSPTSTSTIPTLSPLKNPYDPFG